MDKLFQFTDDKTLTLQTNSLKNLEQKAFVQVNATHQFLAKKNFLINPDKIKYLNFILRPNTS